AQEKLSDVIEVTVTNTSDKPREVGTPTSNASTGFVLTIGADNQLAADQELTGFTRTYGERKQLKPGETVTLLGGGDFTNGADGTLRGLSAGTHQVIVRYHVPTNSSARHVITAETEVTVEN